MQKKKTAVLLFPYFCNFEFAPALEMLSMAEKPVAFFGPTLDIVRSEEGLLARAEMTLDELNLEEYDSLLITGATGDGLEILMKDEAILNFIRKFNRPDMVIGAISSAPMALAKAGLMNGRRYMAGVDREWFEEGGEFPIKLTAKELEGLYDMKRRSELPPGTKFIQDGNIVTSFAWYFREWALAFGRMLKLDPIYPSSFGEDLK